MALLPACAAPTREPAPGATFVVVRHAEKATDDPRDPTLTAAGEARARALAARLDDAGLVAVYATAYLRTQLTARPAAVARGLTVETYDADMAAPEFADALRRTHPRGTVLVVGHSNTVPGIVSALCGCDVAPIADDDFGNLYRVRVNAAGRTRMSQERY